MNRSIWANGEIRTKRRLVMKCIIPLLIIFFLALFLGCSGSGGGSSDESDVNEDPTDITTPTVMSIESMALVLDTSGTPIANAIIPEDIFTDQKGVATGDFEKSSTGWVTVEAIGYMTGYMEADVSKTGVDLYEIRLVPIEAMVLLEDGGSASLVLGDPLQPTHSAALTAASFETTPVTVGISSIEPINIVPLFEPFSTGEALTLQMAFGLEAWSNSLESIALKSGSNISIQIQDNGAMSDNAVLAYFDPESGMWEVVANGCTRDGLNHYNCTLNVVSPLYGLFDDQAADYLSRSLNYRAAVTEGDLGETYKKAKQRYNKRLKELEAICAGDPNCDVTNDAELKEALDDLADAARDYANDNQNENGKFALMMAGQHAISSGSEALGQELIADAGEIAENIGKDLLNDLRCERLREMINSAQQNQLMGSQTVADQLIEKAGNDLKDCDIWEGTITYWFPIDGTHPCTDNLKYQSGSMWQEYHEVRMATNAVSYILTGEDKVRLMFPNVIFKRDDDCQQSIKFYGEPSSAQINLTFDGTYDGYEFSVTNPGQPAQTISIGQKQVMQAKQDDVCQDVADFPLTLSFPNFSSVLVHGFLDSPPITIQEMLEEGSKSTSGFERIFGEELLDNSCLDTGFARYPFSRGRVMWKFTHYQKILPIEE